MDRNEWAPMKPFLSVFLIVSSLFIIVLSKMEERRMGYSIWRLNREMKIAMDERRTLELSVAKLMRPQHVEKFAQDRLTYRKVKGEQIIQLNGGQPLGSDVPYLSEL